MKKKKQENNTFLNFIKELLRTSRGRGILFFAAYFLFFLAVVLVVRFSEPGEVIGTGLERGNPYKFSILNITTNNYLFDYSISIDGNTSRYQGKRYNDSELFSYQSNGGISNYYRKGSSYLMQNGTLWLKGENPYKFQNFLDIDMIAQLLKNATYISKTEYESGKEVYNFQIATATIEKIFEGVDIDIMEVPNEISLITDESLYTSEIQFRLNNYCLYKKICNDNMKITLKYDKYGEIEEIASPIE